MGVAVPVIRGLVAEDIVHAAAAYRFGLSKLVRAMDVERFSERYEATSVLARRFHLNSGSLVRYLKESGTPLLAVPLPDAGRGHAFFLRKDVASQIQIPSRRKLRDAAQRRIVAARKERWGEERHAKENALSKPMRRVHANCKHSGNG